MILRDALRYYELTGADFQNDLEDFGKLQRDYSVGIVGEDFTDKLEYFLDNLKLLWIDKMYYGQNVTEDEITTPSDKELISMFCRVINEQEEKEEENKAVLLSDDLLAKKVKKKKELKVINLVSSIITADVDLGQFMDMELEVVYQTLEIVGDNKKKEADKAKRRNRKV